MTLQEQKDLFDKLAKEKLIWSWVEWFRSKIGWTEFDHDIELSKGWKYTGLNYDTVIGSARAWCAMSLCTALEESGLKSSKSAAARSFSTWGQPCSFQFGAILPIRHAHGNHHVTIFLGWKDEEKKLCFCLGGNQGNSINISVYNLSGNKNGHDELITSPRWPIIQKEKPIEAPIMDNSTFDKAFQMILEHEGGFSDHKDDRGSWTMYGITRAEVSRYLGHEASIDEVKALTIDQAKEIYKKNYWDKLKLDEVKSDLLKLILFDQGVNRGTGTIVLKVQKLLGVSVDGVFGPVTLSKLNAQDPKQFAILFFKDAQKSYIEIVKRNPSQIVFLNGWINRTHKLLDMIIT